MANELKLKHLDYIQDTLVRMANNSFLLKGWSVTLIGAIMGLNKDGLDWKVILISLFLLTIFWALDAYYLKQERIFRAKYDEIRLKKDEEIDFSMKLEGKITSEMDWFIVAFSVTLRLYYGSLLLAIFLFGYFL